MALVDSYKFTLVPEQTRPIGLRLLSIIDDVKKMEIATVRDVRAQPPGHTNGDWKIEVSLEYGHYLASFIKGPDLQAATDQEIFDFIVKGIEDATI